MFGLLNLFGRSREMRHLDGALRDAGLHPRLVPEAVKIAALHLLRDGGPAGEEHRRASAADLLAYCALGRADFAEANGSGRADFVEARVEAAAAAGDGADAGFVLLALHAGLVRADVIDRFALEADERG